MNQPKLELPEAETALLAQGKPLSAAQLAAATGKSQSGPATGPIGHKSSSGQPQFVSRL